MSVVQKLRCESLCESSRETVCENLSISRVGVHRLAEIVRHGERDCR